MEAKELWVQNLSNLDQNLSDLGVKVPLGKTVNIYKANPYLTEMQVQKSLSDGSLSKRLSNNSLKIVKDYANPEPHTLNHLKVSKDVVDIVKAKSSVLIDTKEMDVLQDGDLGGIADYGFDSDSVLPIRSVKKDDDGMVVVEQKQDEEPEVAKTQATKIEIMKDTNLSTQSVVVMTNQVVNASDPVGPVEEAITTPLVSNKVPVKQSNSVVMQVAKQEDKKSEG